MSAYVTKQRKILLDYLSAHTDQQLCASKIATDLKDEGISLSAVYRNLATLEADGKVKRNTKGGTREVYYQYVDDECCKEHLHLYCKKCGKTFHLDTEETSMFVNRIALNDNFKIDKSDTILYGVCKICQE
jgi:Fur family ferric uptake transcriptional regulator